MYLLYNCHETSIIMIFIKNCDVLWIEDYELLQKITKIDSYRKWDVVFIIISFSKLQTST